MSFVRNQVTTRQIGSPRMELRAERAGWTGGARSIAWFASEPGHVVVLRPGALAGQLLSDPME